MRKILFVSAILAALPIAARTQSCSVLPCPTPALAAIEAPSTGPTAAVGRPQNAPSSPAITPRPGSLTDSGGNVWTITPDGTIMEGNRFAPDGRGTSALAIVNGVVYAEDASGKGWLGLSSDGQHWTSATQPPVVAGRVRPATTAATQPVSQTACAATTSGKAGFHVANGRIIGPSDDFIARGLDVHDFNLSWAAARMVGTFKGTNLIRVAVHASDDPSIYAAFVSQMTAQGRVVEFSDYTNSSGENAGGGNQNGNVVFTGVRLAEELAWYSKMGAYYANNPYVWAGADNEPATKGGDVSAWELAQYKAWRSGGNNNIFLLEMPGSRPSNLVALLKPADIAQMTNVVADPHAYNYQSNYSTDQATVNANVRAMVAAAQSLVSADGNVAAILGEYGPSTDDKTQDAGGIQEVAAVIDLGAKHQVGSSAWAYDDGGAVDQLVDGSGNPTNPYGQMVQRYISSDATLPGKGCGNW